MPTDEPTPTRAPDAATDGATMTDVLSEPTTTPTAPDGGDLDGAAPVPAHGASLGAARIAATASATAATDAAVEPAALAPILTLEDVSFYYGAFRAVKDIDIVVPTHRITALIGPSGCGKSTLLRTINRMNDLIPGTRLEGRILYHDQDVYGQGVDPVESLRYE